MIVQLLLFASAREAAGCSRDQFDVPPETPLEALLEAAVARYGPTFGGVLQRARVWVNGDEPPAGRATPLRAGDEVAVLPPVSGGAPS